MFIDKKFFLIILLLFKDSFAAISKSCHCSRTSSLSSVRAVKAYKSSSSYHPNGSSSRPRYLVSSSSSHHDSKVTFFDFVKDVSSFFYFWLIRPIKIVFYYLVVFPVMRTLDLVKRLIVYDLIQDTKSLSNEQSNLVIEISPQREPSVD